MVLSPSNVPYNHILMSVDQWCLVISTCVNESLCVFQCVGVPDLLWIYLRSFIISTLVATMHTLIPMHTSDSCLRHWLRGWTPSKGRWQIGF